MSLIEVHIFGVGTLYFVYVFGPAVKHSGCLYPQSVLTTLNAIQFTMYLHEVSFRVATTY